jgi:hypothetical protein
MARRSGEFAVPAAALLFAAAAALALPACSHDDPPAPAPAQRATTAADAAAARVEYVRESFDDLYPIFLRRRSMPLGEKAKLWTERYLGRWVRWTGTIRSFTPNGVTLKHLPSTITFDVSLWMETDQLATLHKRYKRGDSLTYLGRLDSYDDVFRTLYLGHGLIAAEPPASADAGQP